MLVLAVYILLLNAKGDGSFLVFPSVADWTIFLAYYFKQ